MTFIIDMITGERIVTDQPCDKLQTASATNFPAANEPLVLPALQPVCSQEIKPEPTPDIAGLDIAEILENLDD
ncbi:MAG: hypothetical protein V3W04_11500 [Gammaproteobacteria bacterium]